MASSASTFQSDIEYLSQLTGLLGQLAISPPSENTSKLASQYRNALTIVSDRISEWLNLYSEEEEEYPSGTQFIRSAQQYQRELSPRSIATTVQPVRTVSSPRATQSRNFATVLSPRVSSPRTSSPAVQTSGMTSPGSYKLKYPPPKVSVGDPITYQINGDYYSYQVAEVLGNGRQIVIRPKSGRGESKVLEWRKYKNAGRWIDKDTTAAQFRGSYTLGLDKDQLDPGY